NVAVSVLIAEMVARPRASSGSWRTEPPTWATTALYEPRSCGSGRLHRRGERLHPMQQRPACLVRIDEELGPTGMIVARTDDPTATGNHQLFALPDRRRLQRYVVQAATGSVQESRYWTRTVILRAEHLEPQDRRHLDPRRPDPELLVCALVLQNGTQTP